MDRYIIAALVLGAALVLLLVAESAYSIRDAETASFKTRDVLVHCKAIYESNGQPIPGVMVYAKGSAITDDRGECTLFADGGSFLRLIAYPPEGGQKVVTAPVPADSNELNVVIPI